MHYQFCECLCFLSFSSCYFLLNFEIYFLIIIVWLFSWLKNAKTLIKWRFNGLGSLIFRLFLRKSWICWFKIFFFILFSIQPNLTTREKQLEAWGRLIIDYCQCHKIYSIDLDEIAKSELFFNSKLNRIFLKRIFNWN